MEIHHVYGPLKRWGPGAAVNLLLGTLFYPPSKCLVQLHAPPLLIPLPVKTHH